MNKIKNAPKGFTLLELLVVVVIIAILAAIALPQYRKAVEKSRATRVLALLSTAYESYKLYYLTRNVYPPALRELDIDIPSSFAQDGEWRLNLVNTVSGIFGVCVTRVRGKYTGTKLCRYKEHPYYPIVRQNTNLCIEQKKEDNYNLYIFTGKPGSYCEKILEGEKIYGTEINWEYIYVLP